MTEHRLSSSRHDRPRARRSKGPSRVWTVDEANAALGWVSDVVARAQGLWDDYRRNTVRRARLARQNGHGLVPADPAIQSCIDELATAGIVLRATSAASSTSPPGRRAAGGTGVLARRRGRRRVVALA